MGGQRFEKGGRNAKSPSHCNLVRQSIRRLPRSSVKNRSKPGIDIYGEMEFLKSHEKWGRIIKRGALEKV